MIKNQSLAINVTRKVILQENVLNLVIMTGIEKSIKIILEKSPEIIIDKIIDLKGMVEMISQIETPEPKIMIEEQEVTVMMVIMVQDSLLEKEEMIHIIKGIEI